jgi:hypothetical protein
MYSEVDIKKMLGLLMTISSKYLVITPSNSLLELPWTQIVLLSDLFLYRSPLVASTKNILSGGCHIFIWWTLDNFLGLVLGLGVRFRVRVGSGVKG